MKKHLALVLALIMIFQMCPVSVFAEDDAPAATAESLVWSEEEITAAPAVTEEDASDESGESDDWQSMDSEAIEMAEYHTVTFKEEGITRSKRAVEDGVAPGTAPESQEDRPIYGWTANDEEGKASYFDYENEAVVSDITLNAVHANTEPLTMTVTVEEESKETITLTALAPVGTLPKEVNLEAEEVALPAETGTAVLNAVQYTLRRHRR